MKNWQMITIIVLIIALIYFLRNKINKFFMFDILIGVILKHEGGYVNDPDDLGGETNFGITKRRYPDLDIKNLTKKQAIEIYKKDFYIPMEVEKINDINLALQYFDFGVNAGISTAKKTMVNAISEKEKTGESLLTIYKNMRKKYYTEIAELRNNKKYLQGWLNRVESSKVA
jgi:lysozyme family protein